MPWHFAVGHDVVDPDTGVDEVFGYFDFVVGGIRQLQIMGATGDLQMSELVATR